MSKTLKQKRRERFAARRAMMCKMRTEGAMTLQEIADVFSISRQRVAQIVGKCAGAGFKGGVSQQTVHNEDWMKEHANLTNEEIANRVGLSVSTVENYRRDAWHQAKGGGIAKTKQADLYVANKLRELSAQSWSIELRPANDFADIVINGIIKLDVKYASVPKTSPTYMIGGTGNMWRWTMTNHEDKIGYIDFYVFVIWPTKDCFIMPPEIIKPTRQTMAFVYPNKWNKPSKQKWQSYYERWDLIMKKYWEHKKKSDTFFHASNQEIDNFLKS